MLDLFKQNKWLFLVVGLIVAGFIWYGFSDSQPDALLTSTNIDGTSTARQSASEREIVNTLLELRSLRLDGQIFSDPAFQSLRDFSTDIVSEPVGRDNPFAPLEAPDETVEGVEIAQ